MELGKLVKWNDAKGFGFIELENRKGNVFIHISTLKHMSRKPKVGDSIYFEIQKQEDGKLRAENCRIHGVKTKRTNQISKRKSKHYAQKRSLKSLILLFILMGVLYLFFTKDILNFNNTHIDNSSINQANVESVEKPKPRLVTKENKIPRSIPIVPSFKCEGKQHCSQMKSCEEAKFYIQNCPNTKMDGDNDGVPCERQHCASGIW